MKELVEKLRCIESRISRERGPFNLFALFRLEVDPHTWDLVFSAPWADADEWAAQNYVLLALKKPLAMRERLLIGRVVAIPTDFEALEELYEEHPVEHGKVIVRNREFGLQFVEKGYIITCRPPVAKAA